MGVSEDWYRWFESGRPITVSPRFLARLSGVLRLNAHDHVTLYQLALADLYEADATATFAMPPWMASNVVSISAASDIDEAQRRFDAAREAFLLSEPKDLTAIRSRIVASWERSRSVSIDASLLAAPLALGSDDDLASAREMNRALLAAADPIVSQLQVSLGQMSLCVAIAEAKGWVLQVDGDRSARKLVERAGIVPGGNLGEDTVGTNGVGTVIADARPLQITASEHFTEGGQPLTCTGAPIRDPRSADIVGVLVVMGDYRLVRPTLLSSVIRCALEIEEELAKTLR
jgi:transcriptional regulator of acetoin/glycerol metabolism